MPRTRLYSRGCPCEPTYLQKHMREAFVSVFIWVNGAMMAEVWGGGGGGTGG